MESSADSASSVAFRACQNCTKAKSKCTPNSSNPDGPCFRCHRLKKPCAAKAPAIRKKRAPRITRTAKLEQRLESIVSLLSSAQAQRQGRHSEDSLEQNHSDSESPYPTPDSPRQGSASTADDVGANLPQGQTPLDLNVLREKRTGPYFDHDSAGNFSQQEWHQKMHPTGPVEWPSWMLALRQPSLVLTAYSSAMEPSASEGAELLRSYRKHQLKHFPFVVIGEEVSGEQLKRTRPHVYRAVTMVAAFRRPRTQLTRAKELLGSFTSGLVLGTERTLDLLEGMLIVAAWHYHQIGICTNLSALVHLVMSLAFDLGMYKPRTPEPVEDILEYPQSTAGNPAASAAAAAAKKLRGMVDEQRVYLGCFVLLSTIRMSFRRLDGMRHTPYVDTCCASVLASTESHPHDIFAVATVRLQSVIEKFDDTCARSCSDASTNINAPAFGLHVEYYMSELERIKNDLPKSIQEDPLFQFHYNTVKIHLCSPVLPLTKIPCTTSAQNPPAMPMPTPTQLNLGPSHLSLLSTLFTSSQSTIDLFLTDPKTESFLPYASMLNTAHLVRALLTVLRLCFLPSPDSAQTQAPLTEPVFSSAEIRKKFSILPRLTSIIAMYDRVAANIARNQPRAESANGADVFNLCRRRLETVLFWVETRLREPDGGRSEEDQGLNENANGNANETANQSLHESGEGSMSSLAAQLNMASTSSLSQVLPLLQGSIPGMGQSGHMGTPIPNAQNPGMMSMGATGVGMDPFQASGGLGMGTGTGTGVGMGTEFPMDFWDDDSLRDILSGWNGFL